MMFWTRKPGDLVAFEEKVMTLRAVLAPFGAANRGLSELVDYLHARVFPQRAAYEEFHDGYSAYLAIRCANARSSRSIRSS
jgi:hypothetical protein